MEFLFKSRSEGKRQIKPSQDIQYLEETFPQESSEDSDFKIDTADEDGRLSESDSKDEDGDSQNESDLEDLTRVNEDDEDLSCNLTSSDVIRISNQETSQIPDDILFKSKICACCLGESSSDANEIVECDGCGISVHEGCYGVAESGSVSSVVSEASTEPWFCEPCVAGLSVPPICELCPVLGGIFKETDTGRWVHLVCALYIHGVAFGDPDKLTSITLFELNYTNWGKKFCSLCKEARFSRTGICIQCDAGMCKSYFHATCAQANGLLAEPVLTETDPYIAHCRLHSDKETIKSRKRSHITSVLQAATRKSRIQESMRKCSIEETSEVESATKRIMRKLFLKQSKYSPTLRKEVWIRKMPRFLSSSSSAIRKSQGLAEIVTGVSPSGQRIQDANFLAIKESKKKWHLSPAFNVEFVAYYKDRQDRLDRLKSGLTEEMKKASSLRDHQTNVRIKYEKADAEQDMAFEKNGELRKIFSSYKSTLNSLGIVLSDIKETPSSPEYSKSSIQVKCAICSGNNDQYLLALCHKCSLHYHIGCLSPPLLKMPKNTKLYTWECSECVKKISPDEENGSAIDGPRKLRQKIPFYSAFGLDSDEEDLPIASSGMEATSTKSKKKKKHKKEKIKDPKPQPLKLKIKNLLDDSGLNKTSLVLPKKELKRVSGDSGDDRQFCSKCESPGNNSNLVRCDECLKCYHFSCLIPPLRKSPKVAGYGWHCIDCDPSDVDSDWHLD